MTNAVRRREDWPQRLDEAIARAAEARFRWGSRDCCLAAVTLIRAMTGVDVAAELRGYRTRAEAEALMARHGGVIGLARLIAAEAGAREIPPAFAQRGDAAVVETEQGDALGVVDLDGRMVLAPARRGWARVPLAHARAAWRIDT